MRYNLAKVLLLALLVPSLGVALANGSTPPEGDSPFAPPSTSHREAPFTPRRLHPVVLHRPVPRRSMTDYGRPGRYARLIPKPRAEAAEVHFIRPIDLVKLRSTQRRERGDLSNPRLLATRPYSRRRVGREVTLSASTTGVVPWWTYLTRSVPGIGPAMVNVANLNFLMAAQDVNVPDGGLDLTFQRVCNSQSEHDANNHDNSTPSVFGNKWTNNLDLHLGWSATTGNSGTVSVYTADGARDDYSCQINEVEVCTSETPGVYDLLGAVTVGGGVACTFQWTKTSGVSYLFNAPYSACGNAAGTYGRLTEIVGRNTTFSIELKYSWSPNPNSPENLSQITATHEPDGAQLILTFGQISGTSITELMSITRPDNTLSDYEYDIGGDLIGVDNPEGDPVLAVSESLPTAWPSGTAIPTGNLPEIYALLPHGLLEACGPRAAIGFFPPNNGPTDGACVYFYYSIGTNELSSWSTVGVLNPSPEDGVTNSSIQSGPSTGGEDTTVFSNNEGTDCNPDNEAGTSDAYGHAITWCYDSNGRVDETAAAVSASSSLDTSQTWDNNNDLITTTDAREYTTNIAYDDDGNVVEVALPSQKVSGNRTLRPTSLSDYDQYNNLLYYCDPANNASNGWNPSSSDTLCESSGSTNYTEFTYNPSESEPYGCLQDSYSPRTYQRTYTYGGACGNGMPTEVQGSPMPQADNSTRTPSLSVTYNNNGTVEKYNIGGQGNWQLSYTSNGTNRVRSVQDPDGVTSDECYNPNGTVFYSETAYENSLDNPPGCPTASQIANGATPPKYASGYGYDPDGDQVTVTSHHNCPDAPTYGPVCAANTPVPDGCNQVNVPAGTTCNFYDGLDRLVEVKQPYDTVNDLYKYAWITRYLYDLTGGPQNFHTSQSFSAYGNLFETQELLPSNTSAGTVTPPTPGAITNLTYQATKATAFDGIDRPVTEYTAMGTGSDYTTETLTWDTSPLDPNGVAGFLGEDCNSATPPPSGQCQEFDYTKDGELMTFESNDNSSPERGYVYDPDGRPTTITSGSFSNPQQYTYDPDGNLATAIDASNGNVAQNSASLTHTRYLDGYEKRLDVASGTLTQTGLFTDSYRNDGLLQTYAVNDGSLSVPHNGTTTIAYAYTGAGRFSERSESGAAANASLPPTSETYLSSPNPLGLPKKLTTPVTALSQFSYTVENEMTAVNDAKCGTGGSGAVDVFFYTLRGEGAGSTNCGGTTSQYAANGVQVSMIVPQLQGSGTSFMWNDLMAVLTSAAPTGGGVGSSWSYDAAGRMTLQVAPFAAPTYSPSPVPVSVTRAYDAENHLIVTTFETPSPGPTAWPYASANWGPDGHPITIVTSNNGSSSNNERLHWNGDELLFTTNGSPPVLDDVKIDVQGDILPGDTGYSGLTFYDRGPGGTIMGCHNFTGTSYFGLYPTSGPGGPCSSGQSAGAKMPTSTVWTSSPYRAGKLTVGNGGTLGMMRVDGFTDGYDTIQGVRSYDSTSGAWLSPDAYAGDVYDPASQKSYMWNGNNPMNNADPSGYFTMIPQPPEWGPAFFPSGSPNLCDPGADDGCSGGPKEEIAVFRPCPKNQKCMEATPQGQCEADLNKLQQMGGTLNGVGQMPLLAASPSEEDPTDTNGGNADPGAYGARGAAGAAKSQGFLEVLQFLLGAASWGVLPSNYSAIQNAQQQANKDCNLFLGSPG